MNNKPIINQLLDNFQQKINQVLDDHGVNADKRFYDFMSFLQDFKNNIETQISNMQKRINILEKYIKCPDHLNEDNCDIDCFTMKYVEKFYESESE